MRVLVVGSGGREHALCRAIAASPLCRELLCCPGNAGIAAHADCVPVQADDRPGVLALARARRVDLVVIGPEAPLVAGLVDLLEADGIAAFGPTAAAAALEGSKGFTKALCRRHGIPTADYARFSADEVAAAHAYIDARGAPIVIKADGLAAGKGVTIAHGVAAAHAAVNEALVGDRFGTAGRAVVIEAFLDGEEASLFVLTDGETIVPLATAQDHKAVGEGDTGPNTGGMGACSPAPVLTPALTDRALAEIVAPTVRAMAAEGRRFRGVLYAGLMIVEGPDGPAPMLLEYNVRFGDPECQAILARLGSDLVPALCATRDGTLEAVPVRWHPDASLCVVLAARGYPGRPELGAEIRGLGDAAAMPGIAIDHAATLRGPSGELLVNGGRVLAVTARGTDLAEAQRRAYQAVDLIDCPAVFCRRDIGWRALAHRGAPTT